MRDLEIVKERGAEAGVMSMKNIERMKGSFKPV
jgi:hypothetical protein